ncbi:PAS domain-containing protein [Geothrix oryzisoli]|uniref:PAS domain-containing protein n=1 Tax=Geothrix oryzisoli TaxID=2922721 RepID=UPI001FAD9F0F|nr:PAS domain-containing protein [Geothrix oryzisoli]
MPFADLISALLLPLPPWLGFWIFRRKGRVGLSYGYFLGGILAVMALPWAHLTGLPLPAAQLGGALLGFTIFLQAQREGVQGVRRLAVGVGSASLFLALLLVRIHLPWQSVLHVWAGAALEALLWLVLSDLAYRWTHGRQLELRMPLVGAVTLGVGAVAQLLLPPGASRLSWLAAILAGLLLGLVALQQLKWLREQGAWVEGRGQGLRMALALLEKTGPAELPGLALGLDPRQPMWLVDDQGRILESNGPFSQLVGLPRYQLRGYALDALFQGGDLPVWQAIKNQLLQFGSASVAATQVSEDGTFSEVVLEASAFDRGMGLVWIANPTAGSLTLQAGAAPHAGGDDERRRLGANAMLALATASDRLLADLPAGPSRQAAERMQEAAFRLSPAIPEPEPVEGRAALEALLPGFRKILAPGRSLSLQAVALPLAVEPEALKRIATQLLLHARERTGREDLVLVLEATDLGGRRFGLLHAETAGGAGGWTRELFGLGWLRQSVLEAGGMLELDQDTQAKVRPRVYLPAAAAARPLEGPLLSGRILWIVDRDPLARSAMADLVQRLGGQAETFEDLPQLLRTSRGQAPADALVLERTPKLERFHRALRAFQKEPVPTLVIGLGQSLPVDAGFLGLRRISFLEKPFGSAAFARSVLALLRSPAE